MAYRDTGIPAETFSRANTYPRLCLVVDPKLFTHINAAKALLQRAKAALSEGPLAGS